jgi:putative DNA primase/helicase
VVHDGDQKPASGPGGRAPPSSAELLAAALGYAARGWPVFPCNPNNKQPLLGADKDAGGKPIRGTGGLKKASTDPEQITAWWKRFPNALIGLCAGHPTKGTETAEHPAGLPLLVLDFDPRADAETGEVWTLQRLKGETEAQIGTKLPESLAVLTPSDGVHLYLLAADGGEAIRNRGNLPEHVDVRGLGGYVIAPPSIMTDGRRYRLHRKEPMGGIAKAPEELLAVLRDRGGKGVSIETSAEPRKVSSAGKRQLSGDDAVRKYALAGLDAELQAVRSAGSGRRNAQLNESALKIAALVAAGALEATLARSLLESAARENPGRDSDGQLQATIDSGWSAGLNNPRDLTEIAANARSRLEGRQARRPNPSARGAPPPSAAPRPASAGHGQQGFQSGKAPRDPPPEAARVPSEAETARLRNIALAWLEKRIENAEPNADTLRAIAWGIGRRIAAGHLDGGEAREKLWPLTEQVAELGFDEFDQAVEDGIARGFDPVPLLADLDCSRYPMTDFGIAERFRDRYGHEFRFTTAKGWLGWDGRRWKVLDQDKDTPPAEVIAAAFETIRSIQREARRVAETGIKYRLITIGKQQDLELEDPNLHALDYWMAVGKQWKLFSTVLAGWGRQSEQSGKPGAIAALARRWLTVPIEDFDCEQMAVNVMNGTLRFVVEQLPDGGNKVAVSLAEHRREDLITKLAPVEYQREASSPLYDAMIAWAQPDPAMRRYIHQVAGYASSGDTGEHLLWFNYGRGRNGKSVTIDSWCSALGDYSGTIGIESFLDQGIKKRGDAATPDLAKLGGVRMLRASEPERGAKLNSALIKAATGGEPMSVRALHRGFFDLQPRFKLLMSGNSKPSIPDTDEGIWGRMKLVPWLRHIEKPTEDPYASEFPCPEWPAKDPKLLDKIKARELPGVFARLVEGLVDYLEHRFVEPERVTRATADYRDKSDPLARFLRLCTEADAKSRVKSSELHAVYVAWCKASGEKEWSINGFGDALIDKGFTKVRSDGMRWEGLRLIRAASDFVDAEGRVRSDLPDLDAEPGGARAPPPSAAVAVEDDDLPY